MSSLTGFVRVWEERETMKTALRRDRILNLLHRGTTTAPALALHFGVSERTVYRDIAALRASGHDVLATPGPGGGVSISTDSRPRAVHFEVDEIVGLALSVAILKATPHMPFARSAEAALDRARRALSAERQRAMQRLERRILIGAPASDRTRTGIGPVDDTLLSVFERCFTAGRVMSFDYVDRNGATSSRHIECVALLLQAPAWYVLAWDLEKDARRVFRMDRMSRPISGEALLYRHPLAHAAARDPDDLDCGPPGWIGSPIG